MNDLLQMVTEAPLAVIFGVIILWLLPSIAQGVDSICGLVAVCVILFMANKGMLDKSPGIRIDFHGIKLVVGEPTPETENNTKEDQPASPILTLKELFNMLKKKDK